MWVGSDSVLNTLLHPAGRGRGQDGPTLFAPKWRRRAAFRSAPGSPPVPAPPGPTAAGHTQYARPGRAQPGGGDLEKARRERSKMTRGGSTWVARFTCSHRRNASHNVMRARFPFKKSREAQSVTPAAARCCLRRAAGCAPGGCEAGAAARTARRRRKADQENCCRLRRPEGSQRTRPTRSRRSPRSPTPGRRRCRGCGERRGLPERPSSRDR